MKFWHILLLLIVMLAPDTGIAQSSVQKYWIFFRDKGTASLPKANAGGGRGIVSDRSLRRRAKVRPADALIDAGDLPVNSRYLTALRQQGIRVQAVSKWLNAVSAQLTDAQVSQLHALNFVRGLQRVAKSVRRPEPERETPLNKLSATDPIALPRTMAGTLDYGESALQNLQLNTDSLHAIGVTGTGVLVGMLDSGFLTVHNSYNNLTVVAQYDFVQGDTIVADEPNKAPLDYHPVTGQSQQKHGSQTLGCIGGFKEGFLIGTAYNAEFALAKTEIVHSEVAAEEDYWVQGIEFLDSVGVDIVSSSLGYANEFTDKTDYTPADLDGKTAITTIAAEAAFARGIMVFASAGNERGNVWNNLITPSDGPNVIAVGAIDNNGALTYFSSPGPTADGRIKPDITALGLSTFTMYPDADSLGWYQRVNGTSFSCPLTAGVGAQILSAHPNATPTQVREAIIQSADRYGTANVDNNFGYGVPNALQAALSLGTVFSNEPALDYVVYADGIQPGPPMVTISTHVLAASGLADQGIVFKALMDPQNPATSATRDTVMTVLEDPNRYAAMVGQDFAVDAELAYYFEATDGAGNVSRWPAGAPTEHFTAPLGTTGIDDLTQTATPAEYQLAQNYPNPFNPSTTIAFQLPRSGHVRVQVFDLLGRVVSTLVDDTRDAGEYRVNWNGINDRGMRVASGVYLYRLSAAEYSLTRKMLLLF
jgi:serine protease AprX